jgi:DNA invertase Pin-like site-specific DNA recombinase
METIIIVVINVFHQKGGTMQRKHSTTIGYLRVSTVDQDLDKFRAGILAYANQNDFGRVDFVEEKVSGCKSWRNRHLAEVVESLSAGDRLIVSELSRLGRSLVEVLEVLNILADKSVAVYSVKENFQLNGADMASKVLRTMLALFAEIEHDLIVARTKEGLRAAVAKGAILGRPKGPGKSKLDPYREEIISLLKNGSRRCYIGKKFGSDGANLLHWLRVRKLDNITAVY